MNLKLKALYVAIAMTVAGAAQAAPISIDGFTAGGPFGTGNGGSHIIFSVLDSVSNQSIIVNTGLTVGQFRNNNASLVDAFSFADTGLQSFFSANAANLSTMRWNLGAVSNGPDTTGTGFGANTGVLTSNGTNNPSALPRPSDASVLQAAQVNAANYARANNPNLVSSNSAVSASLSPSGYIGSSNWGGTLGGALLFSNELTGFGGGQTLTFFSFDETDPTLEAIATSYTNGEFRVNTALGSISYVGVNAVPVPAAVWLLGSGLVGLVGISRRRKQA